MQQHMHKLVMMLVLVLVLALLALALLALALLPLLPLLPLHHFLLPSPLHSTPSAFLKKLS